MLIMLIMLTNLFIRHALINQRGLLNINQQWIAFYAEGILGKNSNNKELGKAWRGHGAKFYCNTAPPSVYLQTHLRWGWGRSYWLNFHDFSHQSLISVLLKSR